MQWLRIVLSICCLISSGIAKPASSFAYQDSLGQYNFSYSEPNSTRSEVRYIDGATQGAYSYVDDAGVVQSAQYTADSKNGFRVSATNLPEPPVPVKDTEEVVAARDAHLQEVEKVLDDKVDGETKIGENNIFLKKLNPEEEKKLLKQIKGEKIEKIETKNLEETKSQDTEKLDDKESSEENSKIVVKVSQASLVQEGANATADKLASGTSLKSSQENLKETKNVDTKESNVSTEEQSRTRIKAAIKTSHEIIAPINILPLSPYPSLLRYAPLPSFHYVIYNVH